MEGRLEGGQREETVMKSRRSLQAISVLQAWEPLQVSGKERHDSLGGLAGHSGCSLENRLQGKSQEAGSPGRRPLWLSRQEGLGLGLELGPGQ